MLDPLALQICLVAKWLKRWTADLEVQVLALLTTGIFSLQGTLSPDPKKLRRRVTFVSFGGDIKPSVPRDLV